MSQRKVRRTIDNLRGVGKVTQKGEEIATVSYDLEVTQEFIIVTHPDSLGQAPGRKETRGTAFLLSSQPIPMSRDPHVLVLEDGSEFPFIITGGGGGMYDIERTGG